MDKLHDNNGGYKQMESKKKKIKIKIKEGKQNKEKIETNKINQASK
jgi:hypothetical protein